MAPLEKVVALAHRFKREPAVLEMACVFFTLLLAVRNVVILSVVFAEHRGVCCPLSQGMCLVSQLSLKMV